MFHTIPEELRLGTDAQTMFRTFSHTREKTETTPREEVFALVEFPDKTPNSETLTRGIFSALQEVCFLDQSQDPYERFETALKEVNAVIAEAREKLPNKNLGRVNAVIGILSGRDLHLTQAGEAEAYLIRRGTLTVVTEGLAPDELAPDTFVNIASGRIENHDKVLLASERLLRYATKNELTKIFSPNKAIGLGLEELDEIIVLEGAQTTGVLGIDVVTEAVATRGATEPVFARGSQLGKFTKHFDRGLAWVRDQIPEGTRLPTSVGKLNFDRNYVILGFLVVIILIILSLSWSLGNSNSAAKLEQAKTILTSSQENIDVAKLRRNIGDKADAYARLKTAETALNDLVKSGIAIEEATTKLQDIKTLRDEMDNIKRFTKLAPTADLSTQNKTIALTGITGYHGRNIVYDLHNLYDVALGQVNKALALDAKSIVRGGKYFADRDALVFLTADGKTLEWRDGVLVAIDTEDQTWKSAIDIDTYSSYLYFLDPTNNQIWKYQRKRDNYGKPIDYNVNADLTKAISLAIDGDLWILVNDGDGNPKNDIIRLRKGEKKTLIIKDLPENPWVAPTKIYTNENLKFLYVLDGKTNRILRFYKDPPDITAENKSLDYNMQFLFDGVKEIKDFWVDNAEQKIIITDGQKIYEGGV